MRLVGAPPSLQPGDTIGELKLHLDVPADAAIRGQDFSLELGDAGSAYGIARTSTRLEAGDTIRFRGIVVRPERHVPSGEVRLLGRVLANGSLVDSIAVAAVVRPPTRVALDARGLTPDTLLVGAKQTFGVHVSAIAGDAGRLPVSDAQIVVQLPDGNRLLGRSDSTGVARFSDVVVRASPGRWFVTYSTRASSVTVPVQFAVGPTKDVNLSVSTSREYRVGHSFAVTVRSRDAAGNPARDTVEITVGGGGAYLSERGKVPSSIVHVPTRPDGSASVTDLRYLGPTGTVQIVASAGDAADTSTLVVSYGAPSRIRIVQQPSTNFVADSLLESAPIIRVEDAAGNPVPRVQVTAHLWQSKPLSTPCTYSADQLIDSVRLRRLPCDSTLSRTAQKELERKPAAAFIRGTTLRVSDSTGSIRFDSLRIVGPTAFYHLEFRRFDLNANQRGEFTAQMRYDAERAYNRNFVIVSAIRSIAGSVTPPDEFFDVRFRFRFWRYIHGMVHSDLSVVRRSFTDTSSDVKSNTKRLVDAALLLNWTPPNFKIKNELTDMPERYLFTGGQFRIFNTVPYAGPHVGVVEVAGSLFHGSTFSMAYLTPLQTMPVRVDSETFRPAPANIGFDAFLRSSGFDFLKFLNIRGTMIVPLARGRRPESRIALAVPVGGLISF